MSQPEEYQAVRRHAGLIDCSAWGVVEVRGADRVMFLHNLLTQDIKTLETGSCREAALVTPAAKLLADIVVLAGADAHWLLLLRSRIETVLKTLERYLITEDVALQDRSPEHRIVALQGPTSRDVLEEVAASDALLHPEPPSFLAKARRGARDSVSAMLRLSRGHTHRGASPQRIQDALVLTHSITGSPGFLLVTPAERAAWLWEHVLQLGRAQGARPVGWETWNVLRLEAGIPWYGVDMDESNLLPETGLEARAVSHTKGCYVGQEVITRLVTRGSVSRKLMGLMCEEDGLPASQSLTHAGDPIFSAKSGTDTALVGEITSACFSPMLNRPIAMGYVKRPYYAAGTAVTVMRDDQAIPATLVNPPFVYPSSLVEQPPVRG